jgi:hypothetical protein
MSSDSDETRPLLQGTGNGDRNGVSAEDDGVPKQTSFNIDISRRDFVWILVGLWSTVFLGSMDGEPRPRSHAWASPTRSRRHGRGDTADTHWELLPQVRPGCVPRHVLPALCLLLHAALRPPVGQCVPTCAPPCVQRSRTAPVLGRKGALLLAVSTFTTGTILCGIATSMEMLIVARTIAGIGGGG